jgi:hypothetical protein
MKTTVKPRELSASEITAYALKVLDQEGIEAWRQNNARTVRGRTFKGRKGVPDILGYVRSGPDAAKLVVVEVKKIGDTVKPDQIEFLNKVTSSGAFGFIARQQDGEIVIEEWKVYKQANKIS